MIMLSTRAKNSKPSPTLSIAALAKKLQQEGKDLINLSVGEPDFDTPTHIKTAAIEAIIQGHTKYTAVDGMPLLKKAIQQKFAQDNQLDFSLTEISATHGCKQAIFNAVLALIQSDDEVIIPTPYWVSYPDIVLIAEGKPVFIQTHIDQQFKITPQQLSQAITPKTRLLILNSPSNPTGMVYSEQELGLLAEVLLKHPDIFILSDDMYEHIQWTGKPFRNILNVCPALRSRTIICHGVSKTYAMTGWRLGYAAGPEKLMTAMINLQSQSTSNPNSITQYAAYTALSGDQTCVKQMAAIYQHRHELIYQGLNTIPGISCARAEGAFYSFPDISGILHNPKFHFQSDIDFTAFLLNTAGVVAVPGSAFGNANCIRLSYATDENNILTAIDRIKKALS